MIHSYRSHTSMTQSKVWSTRAVERQRRQAPSSQGGRATRPVPVPRLLSRKNKRTISVRSQKNQRKSSARAKDDGRAAGTPCRTAALPLPVCPRSSQAHSRRSRLPSAAGPGRRPAIDRAASSAAPAFPRKRRPPKCAMIGSRAPHCPRRTRRVPCRHASGSAHAGAAPTVSPAASTVAPRPPPSRQFHVSPSRRLVRAVLSRNGFRADPWR